MRVRSQRRGEIESSVGIPPTLALVAALGQYVRPRMAQISAFSADKTTSAAKEVAGPHAVLEPVESLAVALAVGVVHESEHIRRPGQLELDDRQCQAGMTFEDAGEDHVA